MPWLHLPRSSYNLFVYDFLYEYFGIVGGYKIRRILLCLRSPYDFFRRQTRTKPYRYLAGIVRQPQGYRTSITLSSRPPYKNCTMPIWWPCGLSQGVGTLTVQLSCNYVHGFKRLSIFIFAFYWNCVLKLCDHKSCYKEASVFSWTWSQGMEQHDTFVYILMSSSKFCRFHNVKNHRILQPLF